MQLRWVEDTGFKRQTRKPADGYRPKRRAIPDAYDDDAMVVTGRKWH